MTTYGFRLHTFELRRARTQRPLEFGKGVKDPVGVAASQLTAMVGKLYIRDATYADLQTVAPAVAQLPARTPVLRVDEVTRTGDRIDVAVSYGRVGDYAFVIHTGGGGDTVLKGSAAARQYLNVFYFPKAGTTGIVVSSTTGRTFTGEALLKRMSVENARDALQKPDQGDWLRYVPHILIDEARIDEVSKHADLEGVRLVRKSVNQASAPRTRNLVLTQNGILDSDRPRVKEILTRWVKSLSGAPATAIVKHDEVAALVELVDADVGAVEFNDGTLSFSENGKTQTIGPSNLQRILVYPLGDEEPAATVLRAHAAKRLEPLVKRLNVPIDLV